MFVTEVKKTKETERRRRNEGDDTRNILVYKMRRGWPGHRGATQFIRCTVLYNMEQVRMKIANGNNTDGHIASWCICICIFVSLCCIMTKSIANGQCYSVCVLRGKRGGRGAQWICGICDLVPYALVPCVRPCKFFSSSSSLAAAVVLSFSSSAMPMLCNARKIVLYTVFFSCIHKHSRTQPSTNRNVYIYTEGKPLEKTLLR